MPVEGILYRYRPALARELDALCCNRIYLSNPENFDDPWDCALIESPESRAAINSLRVACFATTDADTRFWSHYATSHHGICIGYHIDQLLEDISRVYEVSYSDVHPGYPEGLTKHSPEAFEAATSLLTTKCEAWGPQRERRIILPATDSPLLEHPQDAIASVTFGLRTHRTIRQHLVNRLGFNPSIEFREIEKMDGVMIPKSKSSHEFPEVGVDLSDNSPYVPKPESGWRCDSWLKFPGKS